MNEQYHCSGSSNEYNVEQETLNYRVENRFINSNKDRNLIKTFALWKSLLIIMFLCVPNSVNGTYVQRNMNPSGLVDFACKNRKAIKNQIKIRESDIFLRIIHTNDIHSRLDPFEKNEQGESCKLSDVADRSTCFGGLARIKYVIDELKNEVDGIGNNFKSLVLDAGDQIQGGYYYSFYKGKATGDIIKSMGFEAMTLGNHEFDQGPTSLTKYLKDIGLPVISADIIVNKTAETELNEIVDSYKIFEEMNLGVIGLTTNDTAWTSSSGPNIEFLDYVDTVNKYVKILNDKGIQRIILLTHIGYEFDKKLASMINPGVSVIVGGHSHSFLYSGDDQKVIGGNKIQGSYPTIIDNNSWTTCIVQAKCWGEYVGHLDIVLDSTGKVVNKYTSGSPIRITSETKENKLIKKKVDIYQNHLYNYINEKLGDSILNIPLVDDMVRLPDTNGTTNIEIKESPMGNMVTRALMVAAKNSNNNQIIDFSLISSGSIKIGLKKGPIIRKNIMEATPFNDAISYATINGTVLVDALNGVLSGYRGNNTVREFVFMDGVRFNWTESIKEYIDESGNSKLNTTRVVDRVYIRKRSTISNGIKGISNYDAYKIGSKVDIREWEIVGPGKNYTFATSDYISNGGENIFLKTEIINLERQYNKKNVEIRDLVDPPTNPRVNTYQIVESYIKSESPIYPISEGRSQPGPLFKN
ncbi:hypothetical protein BB558_002787 [Smittium angustum]|uniref:5'-Nucleotidase C-terminal domain-containing protein n=1 Tax=Smittium angustum TaxID=133377 RepID=A0A2U1J7X1_SMIAN|nr:hypothetical protein BB558_002787 [Smittium angustum]